MLRSTERILVSHAGVLPRPEGLQRLFDAGPRELEAFDAALPGAVADVVARQVAAGVDIVNDGEVSKRGLFIGYIRDRMGGFEERTVRRVSSGRVTPGSPGATAGTSPVSTRRGSAASPAAGSLSPGRVAPR